MHHRLAWLLLRLFTLLYFLGACGENKTHKKTNPPPLGAVAQIFTDVALKYRLPREVLLATVYKESGISPLPSRGIYGSESLTLGLPGGETSIGLPRALLKLTDNPAADSLAVQLDAYGSWVRSNLDAQHLDLTLQTSTPDALYDWIWQLAKMHYSEAQTRKNVQIIFALEMIDILNRGFVWQDATSKERIELKPHSPTLSRTSFSQPIQGNLQLDTQVSELFNVDYFQLSLGENSKIDNQPKRIIVLHCPYRLSLCLGSQSGTSPVQAVALKAHYVIPNDEQLLARPIKILQHRSPVRVTDKDGTQQLLTDAIVIMLVGNSGRFINGSRTQTNPSWYSRNQLKNMGQVIQGVCQLMNRDDPSIDIEKCRTPDLGVEFKVPNGLAYRIGDIPDFDPTIFWSFAKSPDNLSGEVDLQLPANQKLFAAGVNIPINLSFIRGTAKLEVQLLERCPSGKTIWTTLQTQYFRNTDRKSIELSLFDQGPNQNGQHFLRALAFASDGKLMGWATRDLFISNYDSQGTPGPSADLCLASD